MVHIAHPDAKRPSATATIQKVATRDAARTALVDAVDDCLKGWSFGTEHDVPSDFAAFFDRVYADSYMDMFPISYSLLNTNGSAEKPWAMEDVYADARAQFVGRE